MSSLFEAPNLLDEEIQPLAKIIKIAEGEADPRLLRTSYSSSMLLHSCPRKYQLVKLGANQTLDTTKDWRTTLTFAYGHAVGDSIAASLAGELTRDQIVFKMFQEWELDLFDENEKQQKSFFHALYALEKFWVLQDDGILEDYEVATYQDKPAVELSFRINFPDGSSYRGYVDVVLRNKVTGEYVILELKTNSGMYVNHYQYKNSSQAIGYSVVLDKIHPGLTSYSVEYLVWMTRKGEWENFSFPKTYVQRALWIRDRLWDAKTVQTLIDEEGSYGIWPMNGENCVNFMRNCDFMDSCHLSTENLIQPLRETDLEEHTSLYGEPYQFEFNVEELL